MRYKVETQEKDERGQGSSRRPGGGEVKEKGGVGEDNTPKNFLTVTVTCFTHR